MFDPSDPVLGRGLLAFAVLLLGLSAYLAVTQGIAAGHWLHTALWFALAVFMACYGLIQLGLFSYAHRWLLIIGLLAGVAALSLAAQLAFFVQ